MQDQQTVAPPPYVPAPPPPRMDVGVDVGTEAFSGPPMPQSWKMPDPPNWAMNVEPVAGLEQVQLTPDIMAFDKSAYETNLGYNRDEVAKWSVPSFEYEHKSDTNEIFKKISRDVELPIDERVTISREFFNDNAKGIWAEAKNAQERLQGIAKLNDDFDGNKDDLYKQFVPGKIKDLFPDLGERRKFMEEFQLLGFNGLKTSKNPRHIEAHKAIEQGFIDMHPDTRPIRGGTINSKNGNAIANYQMLHAGENALVAFQFQSVDKDGNPGLFDKDNAIEMPWPSDDEVKTEVASIREQAAARRREAEEYAKPQRFIDPGDPGSGFVTMTFTQQLAETTKQDADNLDKEAKSLEMGGPAALVERRLEEKIRTDKNLLSQINSPGFLQEGGKALDKFFVNVATTVDSIPVWGELVTGATKALGSGLEALGGSPEYFGLTDPGDILSQAPGLMKTIDETRPGMAQTRFEGGFGNEIMLGTVENWPQMAAQVASIAIPGGVALATGRAVPGIAAARAASMGPIFASVPGQAKIHVEAKAQGIEAKYGPAIRALENEKRNIDKSKDVADLEATIKQIETEFPMSPDLDKMRADLVTMKSSMADEIDKKIDSVKSAMKAEGDKMRESSNAFAVGSLATEVLSEMIFPNSQLGTGFLRSMRQGGLDVIKEGAEESFNGKMQSMFVNPIIGEYSNPMDLGNRFQEFAQGLAMFAFQIPAQRMVNRAVYGSEEAQLARARGATAARLIAQVEQLQQNTTPSPVDTSTEFLVDASGAQVSNPSFVSQRPNGKFGVQDPEWNQRAAAAGMTTEFDTQAEAEAMAQTRHQNYFKHAMENLVGGDSTERQAAILTSAQIILNAARLAGGLPSEDIFKMIMVEDVRQGPQSATTQPATAEFSFVDGQGDTWTRTDSGWTLTSKNFGNSIGVEVTRPMTEDLAIGAAQYAGIDIPPLATTAAPAAQVPVVTPVANGMPPLATKAQTAAATTPAGQAPVATAPAATAPAITATAPTATTTAPTATTTTPTATATDPAATATAGQAPAGQAAAATAPAATTPPTTATSGTAPSATDPASQAPGVAPAAGTASAPSAAVPTGGSQSATSPAGQQAPVDPNNPVTPVIPEEDLQQSAPATTIPSPAASTKKTQTKAAAQKKANAKTSAGAKATKTQLQQQNTNDKLNLPKLNVVVVGDPTNPKVKALYDKVMKALENPLIHRLYALSGTEIYVGLDADLTKETGHKFKGSSGFATTLHWYTSGRIVVAFRASNHDGTRVDFTVAHEGLHAAENAFMNTSIGKTLAGPANNVFKKGHPSYDKQLDKWMRAEYPGYAGLTVDGKRAETIRAILAGRLTGSTFSRMPSQFNKYVEAFLNFVKKLFADGPPSGALAQYVQKLEEFIDQGLAPQKLASDSPVKQYADVLVAVEGKEGALKLLAVQAKIEKVPFMKDQIKDMIAYIEGLNDQGVSQTPEAQVSDEMAGEEFESEAPVVYSESTADTIEADTKAAVAPGPRLGTSSPTAVKTKTNGAIPDHNISLDRFRTENPSFYRRNALLLAGYPIIGDVGGKVFGRMRKQLANVYREGEKVIDLRVKNNAAKAALKKAMEDEAKAEAVANGLKKSDARKIKAEDIDAVMANPPKNFAALAKTAASTEAALDKGIAKEKALKKAASDKMTDLTKDNGGFTTEDADAVYKNYIDQTEANLEMLIELMPETIRKVAKLWYDGANIIANQFATNYGVSLQQSAAILAVFSPQKDWFMNVSLANRMMDVWKNKQNHVWDANMSAQFRKRMGEPQPKMEKTPDGGKTEVVRDNLIDTRLNPNGWVYKDGAKPVDIVDGVIVWEGIDSKKIKEQMDIAEAFIKKAQDKLSLAQLDPDEKAWFVRMYSETYHPMQYEVVGPDGSFGVNSVTGSGKEKSIAWGGYSTIDKAISVIEAQGDSAALDISNALGAQHKVRSFYNNIVDPSSARDLDGRSTNYGDVTMDTHAIAALLLLPLSGASREVSQNFGGGGSSSDSRAGLNGLYAANAEAYRAAAQKFNLLPREVQSITWEAVRMLFPASWKSNKKNVDQARSIWNDYLYGKTTIDEARERIWELSPASIDPSNPGGPRRGLGRAKEDGIGVGNPEWWETVVSQGSKATGQRSASNQRKVPAIGGFKRGTGRGGRKPGGVSGGRSDTGLLYEASEGVTESSEAAIESSEAAPERTGGTDWKTIRITPAERKFLSSMGKAEFEDMLNRRELGDPFEVFSGYIKILPEYIEPLARYIDTISAERASDRDRIPPSFSNDEFTKRLRSQAKPQGETSPPSSMSEAQDETLWDVPAQSITSADTSINDKKTAATFTKVDFERGTVNADIGGGRFNNATELLKDKGVTNVIFDPFNRPRDENIAASDMIRDGKSDTTTVNNVLNVIREKENRDKVIRQAANAVKPDGVSYFLIYEGNGSGAGKATSKGWQENRKTKDYLDEIKAHYRSVKVRNGLIEATNPIKAGEQPSPTTEPTSVNEEASEEGDTILGAPRNTVAPADAFKSAIEKFGKTKDIAEAGYILPDGTLLDFSGRSQASGYKKVGDYYERTNKGDPDYRAGKRGLDHRDVEWDGMPQYDETWMPMTEFMRMGAVRIDKSGAITLHGRNGITSAQKSRLADLLVESGGEAYLDMEDDSEKSASLTFDGARIGKIAGVIQKWANGWTPEFGVNVMDEDTDVTEPPAWVEMIPKASGNPSIADVGAIMRFGRASDFSTIMHEMGHVLSIIQTYIDPANPMVGTRSLLESLTGSKFIDLYNFATRDGRIDPSTPEGFRAYLERISEGMTRYLVDGEVPINGNKELIDAFKIMRQAMKEILNSFQAQGMPYGISVPDDEKMTDDVTDAYQEILFHIGQSENRDNWELELLTDTDIANKMHLMSLQRWAEEAALNGSDPKLFQFGPTSYQTLAPLVSAASLTVQQKNNGVHPDSFADFKAMIDPNTQLASLTDGQLQLVYQAAGASMPNPIELSIKAKIEAAMAIPLTTLPADVKATTDLIQQAIDAETDKNTIEKLTTIMGQVDTVDNHAQLGIARKRAAYAIGAAAAVRARQASSKLRNMVAGYKAGQADSSIERITTEAGIFLNYAKGLKLKRSTRSLVSQLLNGAILAQKGKISPADYLALLHSASAVVEQDMAKSAQIDFNKGLAAGSRVTEADVRRRADMLKQIVEAELATINTATKPVVKSLLRAMKGISSQKGLIRAAAIINKTFQSRRTREAYSRAKKLAESTRKNLAKGMFGVAGDDVATLATVKTSQVPLSMLSNYLGLVAHLGQNSKRIVITEPILIDIRAWNSGFAQYLANNPPVARGVSAAAASAKKANEAARKAQAMIDFDKAKKSLDRAKFIDSYMRLYGKSKRKALAALDTMRHFLPAIEEAESMDLDHLNSAAINGLIASIEAFNSGIIQSQMVRESNEMQIRNTRDLLLPTLQQAVRHVLATDASVNLDSITPDILERRVASIAASLNFFAHTGKYNKQDLSERLAKAGLTQMDTLFGTVSAMSELISSPMTKLSFDGQVRKAAILESNKIYADAKRHESEGAVTEDLMKAMKSAGLLDVGIWQGNTNFFAPVSAAVGQVTRVLVPPAARSYRREAISRIIGIGLIQRQREANRWSDPSVAAADDNYILWLQTGAAGNVSSEFGRREAVRQQRAAAAIVEALKGLPPTWANIETLLSADNITAIANADAAFDQTGEMVHYLNMMDEAKPLEFFNKYFPINDMSGKEADLGSAAKVASRSMMAVPGSLSSQAASRNRRTDTRLKLVDADFFGVTKRHIAQVTGDEAMSPFVNRMNEAMNRMRRNNDLGGIGSSVIEDIQDQLLEHSYRMAQNIFFDNDVATSVFGVLQSMLKGKALSTIERPFMEAFGAFASAIISNPAKTVGGAIRYMTATQGFPDQLMFDLKSDIALRSGTASMEMDFANVAAAFSGMLNSDFRLPGPIDILKGSANLANKLPTGKGLFGYMQTAYWPRLVKASTHLLTSAGETMVARPFWYGTFTQSLEDQSGVPWSEDNYKNGVYSKEQIDRAQALAETLVSRKFAESTPGTSPTAPLEPLDKPDNAMAAFGRFFQYSFTYWASAQTRNMKAAMVALKDGNAAGYDRRDALGVMASVVAGGMINSILVTTAYNVFANLFKSNNPDEDKRRAERFKTFVGTLDGSAGSEEMRAFYSKMLFRALFSSVAGDKSFTKRMLAAGVLEAGGYAIGKGYTWHGKYDPYKDNITFEMPPSVNNAILGGLSYFTGNDMRIRGEQDTSVTDIMSAHQFFGLASMGVEEAMSLGKSAMNVYDAKIKGDKVDATPSTENMLYFGLMSMNLLPLAGTAFKSVRPKESVSNPSYTTRNEGRDKRTAEKEAAMAADLGDFSERAQKMQSLGPKIAAHYFEHYKKNVALKLEKNQFEDEDKNKIMSRALNEAILTDKDKMKQTITRSYRQMAAAGMGMQFIHSVARLSLAGYGSLPDRGKGSKDAEEIRDFEQANYKSDGLSFYSAYYFGTRFIK